MSKDEQALWALEFPMEEPVEAPDYWDDTPVQSTFAYDKEKDQLVFEDGVGRSLMIQYTSHDGMYNIYTQGLVELEHEVFWHGMEQLMGGRGNARR